MADDLTDGLEADADEFPVVNRPVDGRMDAEQVVVDPWDVLARKEEWFASRKGPPGKFQKPEDVDLELDLLINAGSRPGVGCRRTVFEKCFDNSAAGGRFTKFHYVYQLNTSIQMPTT